jgi:hypothetical protein
VPYKPSSLVEHAWKNPPQCLAEVRAEPLRAPPEGATVFDELGYFQVACRCGSKSVHVLGYPHPEATFLCPLSIQCNECSRTAALFDVEKHGYDAALGNGCYSMRGEGAPQRFACPHCSGVTFEAYPSFSYQIEPIEDLEPEVQAHIQDFFDGFGLDVRCVGCGTLITPIGYECA